MTDEWINLQLRATDRPLDEVLAIPIKISTYVADEEELVKGFLWRAFCSLRLETAARDKENNIDLLRAYTTDVLGMP